RAGGRQPAPPAVPLMEAPRVAVPAPLPVLVVVETPAPVAAPTPAPASVAQGGGAGSQGGAAGGAGGEGGRIKTISSEVEYLRKPSPEYPAKARREHEEGDTLMLVLVSEAGAPLRASVEKSSGSARLDEAARVAVMGALFKPYMENGKALSVYALVPVKFRLSRG
ncbi:energy transducer TonB, partial [Duganella sp. HSC-15S17]